MTARTLEGRSALVTGGSRGIGAGIAARLAAEGARVCVTYVSRPDRADALVAAITAEGGTAVALQADSADPDAVIDSVRTTAETFGGLDILVNNAGGGRLDPIGVATREQIQWILDVNVRATVLATQEALNHMGEGGRILNIGSVNADRMPIPGGSAYSMSKGAVAGFTRGLARELAPRKITVNTLQPGPVDTDLNSASGPLASEMLRYLAVDRFGTIDEVGALAAFLAGPDAAFITGTAITIDGGFGA